MKPLFSFLLILILAVSCKTDKKSKATFTQETAVDSLKLGMVQVITNSMDFITADTLYSGWNKITYENRSTEVHFIQMDLYPAGKNITNTKSEILPPFDEGMKQIMMGDMDKAMAAFGQIPEWFQQIKFMGGTGLISPKHTAKSTIYLEPGLYIMECYVKMFNGEWHTSHGMVKQIIVREESTDLEPLTPTVTLNISSTDGIVLQDSITSGKQVFQTNFLDQKIYEHFLGHDVNLVRYDSSAKMDSLLIWMNWASPRGLTTPAPEGFAFLGGMNNLPAGEKGFFEANLTPGNYILISEVPEANDKKLMHTFTIKP